MIYRPGDTVLITDIGDGVFGSADPGLALVCNTSNVNNHCCRAVNNPNGPSLGEWYFPNGTIVPRERDNPNAGILRTGFDHEVRLNRRNDNILAPLGAYTCVVPNMNNTMNHTATITLGE